MNIIIITEPIKDISISSSHFDYWEIEYYMSKIFFYFEFWLFNQ